tara:strand:- start:11700 stop:12038 length:339 start_codon:yes stop_codon:yes gene_type:complete
MTDLSVDSLYEAVKGYLNGGELNTTNVLQTLTHTMRIVERSQGDGSYKKQLVVQVVEKLVDEISDDNVKVQLGTMVQLFLPSIIDSICNMGKSDSGINDVANQPHLKLFWCC